MRPFGFAAASLLVAYGVACGGEPDTIPIDTDNDDAGSSSSSGGSSGSDVNTGQCDISGDSPCQQCTAQKCRAQAEACFCGTGADTCDAYFEAEVECLSLPEDDAGTAALDQCVAKAKADHPKGSSDSKAYDDCQVSNCPSDCSQ